MSAIKQLQEEEEGAEKDDFLMWVKGECENMSKYDLKFLNISLFVLFSLLFFTDTLVLEIKNIAKLPMLQLCVKQQLIIRQN